MGFLDQVSNTQAIDVTLLTAGFQAVGTLDVVGMIQTFVNDDRKNVFTLRDAQSYGLVRDNPATSIRIPELFVRKDECHVVAFSERFSAEHMGLMPRSERVAVYTSHFVIQGTFYMGADSLISDFIQMSKSLFVAATDVSIFPLFPAQTALVQHAPLVFIHRDSVRLHHTL